MDDEKLPAYDDLPVRPDAPAGSSWGVWGEHDVFGCLNLLTPERVVEAARLVRRGAVFPLDLEMELPGPPLFGRPAFEHDVAWLGGREVGQDDRLSNWNTQGSTQWDGFRHIRSVEGFYGGVANEEHGMHHWAQRGIAGRAVLLDVARWREAVGRPLDVTANEPIEAAELVETADAQGVELRTGDILLIRTGWVSWYRGLSEAERSAVSVSPTFAAPGLRGTEETARVLWNLHVAAVAADNPAFEVWPPPMTEQPLSEVFVHLRLLPLLGIPIGELWDLDRLAADCAEDGVWEGMITSAPLNLRGGVGSPPNAVVLK